MFFFFWSSYTYSKITWRVHHEDAPWFRLLVVNSSGYSGRRCQSKIKQPRNTHHVMLVSFCGPSLLLCGPYNEPLQWFMIIHTRNYTAHKCTVNRQLAWPHTLSRQIWLQYTLYFSNYNLTQRNMNTSPITLLPAVLAMMSLCTESLSSTGTTITMLYFLAICSGSKCVNWSQYMSDKGYWVQRLPHNLY